MVDCSGPLCTYLKRRGEDYCCATKGEICGARVDLRVIIFKSEWGVCVCVCVCGRRSLIMMMKGFRTLQCAVEASSLTHPGATHFFVLFCSFLF